MYKIIVSHLDHDCGHDPHHVNDHDLRESDHDLKRKIHITCVKFHDDQLIYGFLNSLSDNLYVL